MPPALKISGAPCPCLFRCGGWGCWRVQRRQCGTDAGSNNGAETHKSRLPAYHTRRSVIREIRIDLHWQKQSASGRFSLCFSRLLFVGSAIGLWSLKWLLFALIARCGFRTGLGSCVGAIGASFLPNRARPSSLALTWTLPVGIMVSLSTNGRLALQPVVAGRGQLSIVSIAADDAFSRLYSLSVAPSGVSPSCCSKRAMVHSVLTSSPVRWRFRAI